MTTDLPVELDQQIRSEMRVNEKLVWTAQPLSAWFRRQSMGLVLFAIPWTAFSLFMMMKAAEGATGVGWLFNGVPFLVIE